MSLTSPFNPTPHQAARLFDLLADPAESFLSIAARFKTTLAELNLFLASPDIAEQFSSLDSAFAHRTRFVATANLPAAVATALQIINEFNASPQSSPTSPNPCSRETALRAARIVVRLSNFAPGPVARRPASRPSKPDIHNPSEHPVFAAPLDTKPHDAAIAVESSRSSGLMQSNVKEAEPVRIAPQAPATHDNANAASSLAESSPESPISDPFSETLTEEETLLLAADLIRKGAFSESEIDEAFRIAAAEIQAESGEPSVDANTSETQVRHAVREFLASIPP